MIQSKTRPPRFPRLRSPWIAAAILLGVLAAAVMVLSGGWLSPIARREIVRALQQRYESLEIRFLAVSLFPYPHATGEALVLRQKGRADAPPLIAVRRFEASAGWFGLLLSPHRVSKVRLEGLEIRVTHGEKKPGEERGWPNRSSKEGRAAFVIGEIVADGTVLEVLPATSGKAPLRFDIYKLTLHSAGTNQPMHYQAQLRNAKPPGLIQAAGNFGPWNVEDPGQTPVTGDYRFSNADLGVFKGLSGKLSSTGNFHGLLERLEVSGQTDTPDFNVKAGNHPVDLKTTFSATVDGVNGDTLLHPVTAHFGQTTVVAQGGVTGTPGVKGKTVSLNGSVENGNLADVLRLGVKSDPPTMTGRISFHSKIVIPPGERDIADKLKLDGVFDIESGKFTSSKLQQKVSSLSEHARGVTDGNGTSAAVSNLRGKFVLDNGTITLWGLVFHVSGATIRLDGTYGLQTEQLDFRGTATMEAKVSEMTTGIKSFLLKALDPLFQTNKAGAVIPIHISGTRESPSFGLDLRHKR